MDAMDIHNELHQKHNDPHFLILVVVVAIYDMHESHISEIC